MDWELVTLLISFITLVIAVVIFARQDALEKVVSSTIMPLRMNIEAIRTVETVLEHIEEKQNTLLSRTSPVGVVRDPIGEGLSWENPVLIEHKPSEKPKRKRGRPKKAPKS